MNEKDVVQLSQVLAYDLVQLQNEVVLEKLFMEDLNRSKLALLKQNLEGLFH